MFLLAFRGGGDAKRGLQEICEGNCKGALLKIAKGFAK